MTSSFPAICAVLSAVLAQSPALPDLQELLGRLAQHESQVAAYNQVTQTMTEQELDADGRATDESVAVMRVTTWGPDKTETVVVSSVHNGKDNTRERREAQRDSHPGDVKIRARNPFKPEEQVKYAFRLVGPDGDAGLWRIHFEPKTAGAPGLLGGDAWVNIKEGTISRMSASPSKLPEHADKVSMRFEYSASTPAGPALSKIVTEGEGHFLLFHQRMRATLAVTDYQRAASSEH
jgi:hypothetical protein